MDSAATFRLCVWLLFFLGVALHILISARASIAARSNAVRTFRAWWDHNWHDLGWRLFMSGAALMLWSTINPRVLGANSFLASLIPPVTYQAAPWAGFAADRFIASLGFTFGVGQDMGHVAPTQEPEQTNLVE